MDSGHNNSWARWSGHYSGDKPFVHMHQGQTLTAHLSDSQIPSDFYVAGSRLQTSIWSSDQFVFPHQVAIWLVMLWQSNFGKLDVCVCSDRDVSALMPETLLIVWLPLPWARARLRVKLLNSPIPSWQLTLKPKTLWLLQISLFQLPSPFAFFLFWRLTSISHCSYSIAIA